MPENTGGSSTLTVIQAAEELGYTPDHIQRLIGNGNLTEVPGGMITRFSVNSFIARRAVRREGNARIAAEMESPLGRFTRTTDTQYPNDRRWFLCRHCGNLFIGPAPDAMPVQDEKTACEEHEAGCEAAQ